jgi:hypothetical protein
MRWDPIDACASLVGPEPIVKLTLELAKQDPVKMTPTASTYSKTTSACKIDHP